MQALPKTPSNSRQKPLRIVLQSNLPQRLKQSLQPKKKKQNNPSTIQKNHKTMRHLWLRQNRRHPPHRLKQDKQFPKKSNRPLPKSPQNDQQSQLQTRNLHNSQTKRIRTTPRNYPYIPILKNYFNKL